MSDRQVLLVQVAVDGEQEGEEYKKAVAELRRELTRYLPDRALPAASDDGSDKGLPAGLINIDIGIGDALAELARCLRDWFARRRQVSIEVSCGEDADGTRRTAVIAKGATEEEIRVALQQLAGNAA